jgi:hypothetical protein
MKRLMAIALVVSFLTPTVLLAVDGNKAAYFGGTVTAFAGAKDPIEGKLDTGNAEALILTAEDKPFAGQTLRIPVQIDHRSGVRTKGRPACRGGRGHERPARPDWAPIPVIEEAQAFSDDRVQR